MQKTGGPLIYVQQADKIKNLGLSYYIREREAAEAYASLMGGLWMPRWDMEEDPTYRQVIPYVIVQNIDTGKFVVMDRMKTQTEARLHGNVYIGVGGHIEHEDQVDDMTSAENVIVAAAWREIIEEIGFTTGHLYNAGILCINHPDEPLVNRVHIGVVYHLLTHETEFNGEKDKQNYRWEDVTQIREQFDRLEMWSKLVAEHYVKCFHEPRS